MSLFLPWAGLKSNPLKRLSALLLLSIIGSLTSHAQVSGKVFYDFDANGIQTFSAPIEAGAPNIGVRIYVNGSTQPFITQTDTAGNYAFSAQQVPAGSKARVEFFDLPETFFVSPVGPQNGTEIQFVQAPATNVNLAIFNEDEFCRSTSEVKIVTACYAMGDPLKPGSAGEDPALVLFDYTASGEAGTASGPTLEKLANANKIGSTWISSYQRASNTLLIGAITRRHVGLGPLGTGGFYSIDLKTKVVSNFIDVKTVGINTGPDPHIDPSTGQNILPGDKLARSRDSLAFHAAAKVGIGGAQLSPYQDTLFLINLYDKKLYSFKIGVPLIAPANSTEAQTKSYQIPNPGCSNNDFAPWALKYFRGKLYVGVVCTAETSQKKSDMKAAIYEFSPKTRVFRNMFEFSLNYPRGPIDATKGCDTINTWMPWTNVFPKQCNYPSGAPDPVAAFAVYPQAILSDIEFDDDGSLLIAFMDRLGLQTGQNQPGIAVNDTLNYYGFMSGDMLRAQYNANGTYTLENNAQSGTFVGCGVNTDSGPGGGEFFCEDYWINAKDSVGHAEITNGGMFKIPGISEVLVSSMDPVHKVYLSTGYVAFDTKTGKRKRSFSVYSLSPGSLGKSGGVGDLAGVCEPTPLEIGNRVWIDKNRNGIQDPNEGGIDGLILTLHDMGNSGVVVAKDTTANGGQFYFNDQNVSGKLKRNHPYEIRLQTNQTVNSAIYQAASNLKVAATSFILKDSLTVTKSDTSSANILRNSDANYNSDSTQIVISLLTRDNSPTDHSEDIGLISTVFPASVGDYAWYDLNRNGIQDLRKDPLGNILGPELPVKGVVMELRNTGGQFVKSDTTGVDGKYLIGNIEPGEYYIKFNPVSYPAPDFVVTDLNKGTNDSLDNDIERAIYKTSNFNLTSGQQDLRWDIGFFRAATPEISDPCACDSTILYLPGDDDFTKYVYREKVTVKATPGGKWMLIPQHIKNNITTYGLYEDDGEGYIDPIDLNKKQYFLTEVPDSLGVYEFKFAHKSADGYALAVTDGVDTLSIGAICYEVKEQYDTRLDTLCASSEKLQLQRIFPNGKATYYFIDTTAFVFKDGFNEFTLLEAAVKRGAITELDPKNYTPNSTISLYMKWEPNLVPGQKGACQKSMILNIKITNHGDCIPSASVGDYAWYDLNRNGIQDIRKDPFGTVLGPELPAKGVIMELYNGGGQFVKSDTTGADGKYTIGALKSGQYHIKFNPVSYPASDFVVADLNKGTNDSLDNDIPRVTYKTADFNLAIGQHDPRWDMGFFRATSPEISDPCACDSTILYFPGNDNYSKYVYREKVTIKATPGGKWAIIPYDLKKNIYTYGLYEDDGEGYIDSIDLNKKHYFFTEVPDSLGVYEFKFAHKSVDGYALAATDGVDTLSIGAICYEVKEQYDSRLDSTLCSNGDKIQLQRNFPNGTATYYLIDTTAFVFRDGFNEFTLLEEVVKRGPITELDPKKYTPNSTISLYVKWEPKGISNKKGACQKSMILNVKISNTGACTPSNDLELTKTLVGDCRRQVGDEVQFKLIIKNNTPNPLASADSVYVKDMMPANFNFVKYVSSQGQYSTQTNQWGPLTLAAGETDTLTLTVKINNTGGFIGGTICNEAEIVAMSKKSGRDTDSAPNNGLHTEDDYDIACVSVPLKICPARKDTVIISAPAGYTQYQWFKNGTKIVGATAQTLEVGAAGSYSVEVDNGQCPTKNCCPAIVEEECICPPEICVPFTTKKIKKK